MVLHTGPGSGVIERPPIGLPDVQRGQIAVSWLEVSELSCVGSRTVICMTRGSISDPPINPSSRTPTLPCASDPVGGYSRAYPNVVLL
jgi:hypothetical protein